MIVRNKTVAQINKSLGNVMGWMLKKKRKINAINKLRENYLKWIGMTRRIPLIFIKPTNQLRMRMLLK